VCPECLESQDLNWFEPKSAVNIGLGLPVAIRLFRTFPGLCRYCIKQKLHDAELVVGVAKGEIREWPTVPGDQLELGG
jgi:hypothetical protein